MKKKGTWGGKRVSTKPKKEKTEVIRVRSANKKMLKAIDRFNDLEVHEEKKEAYNLLKEPLNDLVKKLNEEQ